MVSLFAMKIRSAAFICLGILMGAGCAIGWHFYDTSNERVISRNWQIVNEFTTIMRGDSPSNTRVQDGLRITEYSVDPDPAFAFLVSKRELYYADLVFPTVMNSRENNAIWMEFTSKHYPDIIWVTGHSNMGQFKTTGNYPLHLNVWYKKTEQATELVNELIRLLESSAAVQSK